MLLRFCIDLSTLLYLLYRLGRGESWFKMFPADSLFVRLSPAYISWLTLQGEKGVHLV